MKRWLLLLCLSLAAPLFADEVRPFQPGSRAAIEQAHAGKPFVLAFWSLDCVYCPDEIKHLGALARQQPDIRLVLVNVDGGEHRAAAGKRLASLLPEGHGERWIFAGQDPERLFFSVDRQWHGELPRAYFYDGKGGVQGKSGKVSASWLVEWARAVVQK
jgi:thiol-disulfide isomerase/thioredoxin